MASSSALLFLLLTLTVSMSCHKPESIYPLPNIKSSKYMGESNDFLRFNEDLAAHEYEYDGPLLPGTIRA